MRKTIWALGAAAFAFFMLNRCAVALADTLSPVQLPKELYSAVIDYVFLGLTGLLGWAIKRGADLLHVRRESLLVDRLEQGMTYALMYAREKALEQGRDITLFHTRSELVAVAASYLLPKMPGALKELGIDPEGLRERLTGRLDLVAPLATPGPSTTGL